MKNNVNNNAWDIDHWECWGSFYLSRDDDTVPNPHYTLWLGGRPVKQESKAGKRWCCSKIDCKTIGFWEMDVFPFKEFKLAAGKCAKVKIGSLVKVKK